MDYSLPRKMKQKALVVRFEVLVNKLYERISRKGAKAQRRREEIIQDEKLFNSLRSSLRLCAFAGNCLSFCSSSARIDKTALNVISHINVWKYKH